MRSESVADPLIRAARRLSAAARRLTFAPPVTHVYRPLEYAWDVHEKYIRLFGASRKKVLFLGMNPGPFGMMQTGVPFGEIRTVKEWMRLSGVVRKPAHEHPRRPILGMECPRSEVSGARLWGLFEKRFGSAELFFQDHYVLNYCPLAFLEASGRNFTPDKLQDVEAEPLARICDAHLASVVEALSPTWLIGVGGFAEKRLRFLFANSSYKLNRILHPSPASPAANRDWAGQAERALEAMGAWPAGNSV